MYKITEKQIKSQAINYIFYEMQFNRWEMQFGNKTIKLVPSEINTEYKEMKTKIRLIKFK